MGKILLRWNKFKLLHIVSGNILKHLSINCPNLVGICGSKLILTEHCLVTQQNYFLKSCIRFPVIRTYSEGSFMLSFVITMASSLMPMYFSMKLILD